MAAPVVKVSDLNNVLIDGVNYGAALDVVVNNPGLGPAVQNALVAKWNEREQEHVEVVAEKLTKISELQTNVETKVAQITELETNFDRKVAEEVARRVAEKEK